MNIRVHKTLPFYMAFFMAFSFPAFAEMYMWTDDQGIKHYSNQKPPETVDEFEIKPEVELEDASETPPDEREMEDAELEQRVQIRKEKDKEDKARWMKEQQKEKALQLEKEEKRKDAIRNARDDIQAIEKRLERYQDRQRKRGRNDYENTIREITEQLFEAKKKLRAMELHGDFSDVD